jgi:glycosyltransferase involved in cell wall biosynthesis
MAGLFRVDETLSRPVKISISATNPCHLYPFAQELAQRGALGCYYSGYPAWKLPGGEKLPLATHTLRTNIVYGLLKFVPKWARPEPKQLFTWQDRGFDRWVGQHLAPCEFIHAMPGQALEIFRAAQKQGIRTVLNHATGPVREWVKIMEPEYERAKLKLTDFCPYDAAYFAREDEEYELTDIHCAASSVVRDQLIVLGIAPEKIWTVPYGADSAIFHPAKREPHGDFRIVFAGLAGLRKGVRCLLKALEITEPDCPWRLDFYGGTLPEVKEDLATYRGKIPLHFHGAISQRELSAAFQQGDVLVLPSIEEGFGLVVPQALACGIPAIVSESVGAKDLLRHRDNGSIFPVQNVESLAAELKWWSQNRKTLNETHSWSAPAEKLLNLSQTF